MWLDFVGVGALFEAGCRAICCSQKASVDAPNTPILRPAAAVVPRNSPSLSTFWATSRPFPPILLVMLVF